MITGGRRGLLIAIVSGWTLWHDVAVYVAPAHTRLGGQTYAATAYDTEAGCQTGQRMAGVTVWDASLQHYTTFRYHCAPSGP